MHPYVLQVILNCIKRGNPVSLVQGTQQDLDYCLQRGFIRPYSGIPVHGSVQPIQPCGDLPVPNPNDLLTPAWELTRLGETLLTDLALARGDEARTRVMKEYTQMELRVVVEGCYGEDGFRYVRHAEVYCLPEGWSLGHVDAFLRQHGFQPKGDK